MIGKTQKYDWHIIYIGQDEETKEPKEMGAEGKILTRTTRKSKIQRLVSNNLGVHKDHVVFFQCTINNEK